MNTTRDEKRGTRDEGRRRKEKFVHRPSEAVIPRRPIIKARWKLVLCGAALLMPLFAAPCPASAQDDALRLVEAKRLELKEKEDTLKREELRLNVIRKDVDEKIAAYTKLLARVEETLKKVEKIQGEKIENVVKAYEAMPPEDAAARLVALDEETALLIMSRMKSKKAGAVIALMEPRKAAALTKKLTTLKLSKEP